jgi:hypothetical protein
MDIFGGSCSPIRRLIGGLGLSVLLIPNETAKINWTNINIVIKIQIKAPRTRRQKLWINLWTT